MKKACNNHIRFIRGQLAHGGATMRAGRKHGHEVHVITWPEEQAAFATVNILRRGWKRRKGVPDIW